VDDTTKLETVLREMQAYGLGWRMFWGDFDGRTLRDQLNSLADWARGDGEKDYTEGTEFLQRKEDY